MMWEGFRLRRIGMTWYDAKCWYIQKGGFSLPGNTYYFLRHTSEWHASSTRRLLRHTDIDRFCNIVARYSKFREWKSLTDWLSCERRYNDDNCSICRNSSCGWMGVCYDTLFSSKYMNGLWYMYDFVFVNVFVNKSIPIWFCYYPFFTSGNKGQETNRHIPRYA